MLGEELQKAQMGMMHNWVEESVQRKWCLMLIIFSSVREQHGKKSKMILASKLKAGTFSLQGMRFDAGQK